MDAITRSAELELEIQAEPSRFRVLTGDRPTGPRGVTDRAQPLGRGRRQPGGGDPGRLGLHRDHRDVVGDHVVQFA